MDMDYEVGEPSAKRMRVEHKEPDSRPFSSFLSSSSFRRSKKHPVLSDKKLIVYNLKVERPPLPDQFEEDAWTKLKQAIHAIQSHTKPTESLEVLYQLCENLCQYNLGEKLCDQFYAECSSYVKQEFAKLENDTTEDGRTYLKSVDVWWRTYCDQLSQIRAIFLYLDRTTAASLYGSLWNLGMIMFGEVYQDCQKVRQRVIENALDLVRCERDGKDADSPLLQSVLHMLIDLKRYHRDFEPRLLEESKNYYDAEGNRLVQEMDMSMYLEHVAYRIHQEVQHVNTKKLFDKSTKVPLNSIVEHELLTKRSKCILDKCFTSFMQNNSEEDLSLLYRLLRKVNSLDTCVKFFGDYVKKEGVSMLKKRGVSDKEVVPLISAFKRKTDIIMRHSFEGDERFFDARKEGFRYFINLREHRTARLLSAYTDHVMRNSDKTEDKLEKGLEQAMAIFRLLHGKDYFQALYRRDLSKRLLLEVKSRNAEKSMLTKLRKECGLAYTSKLEGMLRDIKYSHDMLNEFKATPAYSQTDISFTFKVNILTYGFWPSYTPIHINLPEEFDKIQTKYQEFYNAKYSGRRLTWQNSLGVCDVTANYPLGVQELTLTLLQTVVLLIFNDDSKTSLSFSEILQATNLDELELRRTLKSLACGEHKLIVKFPDGENVDDTDTFTYNEGYASSLQRVRMNTDKLKEVIESNTTMPRTVLISRDQQTDAAIVRIMKAKRQLSHGALLGEVVRQIQFPATAQDVKKRIESLIEKDYLMRTEDDGYQYLE
ncbi:cullin 4 [Zychaea mexicana]|uniref:cullin 4 n=1 Tax=Zychaea mexicana TaxID=64656 RepID=UPI0022FE2FD3|nr:cullin 4 [Zychaea mexicana]KAI9499099.1 cullin 4 [Zychaea mexicana]